MRQWIDLFEMRNSVTQRYIEVALDRLDALPPDVGVTLNDDDIYGFADLPNMVEIYSIDVDDELQGQGYGSQALRILTQLADEMGVTLVLTVATSTEDEEDDWPMTSDDLMSWYERYGFVGDRKMIREPQSS